MWPPLTCQLYVSGSPLGSVAVTAIVDVALSRIDEGVPAGPPVIEGALFPEGSDHGSFVVGGP
jgi:hypothetical protein